MMRADDMRLDRWQDFRQQLHIDAPGFAQSQHRVVIKRVGVTEASSAQLTSAAG
jgi:hypothetical protein